MSDVRTVWTIGHSNHAEGRFLELLALHSIAVVVDVRTSPYSKYARQFNGDLLGHLLHGRGIHYLFMGTELGGRPADPRMYDEDGRVRYDLVASTHGYRQSVDRIIRASESQPTALMCGEEDPISCHRRRLVGRSLRDLGVALVHIRGDGSLSTERDLEARESVEFPGRSQLTLAGPPPWRSEHPVKKPQPMDGHT